MYVQVIIIDFMKDMLYFCQQSSHIDPRSKVKVTCSIFLNKYISSCIGLTSCTRVLTGPTEVQDIFLMLQLLQ